MESYARYTELILPLWAPPAWVFGPVWTVLYVIIAISFGVVFKKTAAKAIPKPVALPFLLNIACNLAFTPIQFGLRNNLLASVDIVLVLATLVWGMKAVWSHARWVALVNIPYFLWVCFATVLQVTITYLN